MSELPLVAPRRTLGGGEGWGVQSSGTASDPHSVAAFKSRHHLLNVWSSHSSKLRWDS